VQRVQTVRDSSRHDHVIGALAEDLHVVALAAAARGGGGRGATGWARVGTCHNDRHAPAGGREVQRCKQLVILS